MNKTCSIIGDLLPLYVDQQLSEESKILIEEHIKGCSACKQLFENMNSNILEKNIICEKEKSIVSNPFKKVKRFNRRMLIITAILSGVISLGGLTSILYSIGGWQQVGKVFNVDHAKIISNKEYTEQLKEIIGEKEGWDTSKIEIGSPAQMFSWSSKNDWTFYRKIAYEGKEYIVMIYAEEIFIGQFNLEGYEFGQMNSVENRVTFSRGSFVIGD